jgi:Lar family restriction alleviation protein
MQSELNRPAMLAAAHGSALAPCPFCGLTDKDTVSHDMGRVAAVAMHSYPQGYRVECEGCFCNGPWHHNHPEAIVAWNRRPNIVLGDNRAVLWSPYSYGL